MSFPAKDAQMRPKRREPGMTKAQMTRRAEDARRASGQKRMTVWVDQAAYDAGYYAALAGKSLELPRTHRAAYVLGFERGLQVEVEVDDNGDEA